MKNKIIIKGKLNDFADNNYLNISTKSKKEKSGFEELAYSPVSKTGGSQALWVRNSPKFPHPARKLKNGISHPLNKNNLIALFSILLILLSSLALAIPDTMTLQGKLTNLAGAVQTGTFNFTFKVYDSFTDGNVLWRHVNMSVTTDSNGIYDIILQNLSSLNFSEQYYLAIAVNNDGESDPRINLTSSPYSFRANISEQLNRENRYEVSVLNITGNLSIGDEFSDILTVVTGRLNITDGEIKTAGNVTLGRRIIFSLGAIIDNIVSGFLRINSALNVTGNVTIAQDTLFVDNTSGRVGIGTASPNTKLTVIGGINASGGLNVTAGDVLLAITSGNVGIGTITPNTKLEVNGTATFGGDVNVPRNNINVGGGYASGGVTLVGTGADKGSGQFGKDILLDGNIISVFDVEINQSFIPTKDKFSLLGNVSQRFLRAFVVNLHAGNETLTLNANATLVGNLSFVDAETYIYYPAANTLAFGTAGAERARIDSSGQVGIGDATPAAALEVVGNVIVSGSLNASSINATSINVTSLILGWTNLTTYPSACSAGQFVTTVGDTLTCDTPAPASGGGWTDDGTIVRLANGGDLVGIGTTKADNRLTIAGNDTDSYLDVPSILHLNVTDSQNTTLTNIITLDHLLNNPLNATNPEAGVSGGIGLGILFRAINNISEIINVSFINATLVDARNGSEAGALTFYTANASGSTSGVETRLVPRLILNGTDVFINPSGSDGDTYINPNGGNVGIGTTVPQNALDIVGAVTVSKGLNASNLNVTGFSITDDSLVTLSDGSKKKIKDIKAGEEVLTLEEATGKIVPRKVNALLDHGIKPIYEMKTEDGRAINTTAEHPYLVKLHSKEECDKYDGNVWNKEADEFDERGYCTRWIQVSDLEEGTEIAVPRIEEDYPIPLDFLSSLNNSSVLNTLTTSCLLNNFSSDQIGQLSDNAKAKYGTSLVFGGASLACGANSMALDKNLSCSSFGMDSIIFSSNEKNIINSNPLIPEYFCIFPLSFANSSNTKSAEINLNPSFGDAWIISLLAEERLKNENNILASTTKNIYISPYLFATLPFNSSPSLSANSSVILLFFNTLSAYLNNNAVVDSSLNALETIPLNSSLLISLATTSKSSGISTFNSAILTSPEQNNENSYLKLSNDAPLGEWIEVRYLKIGDEIAVPDYPTGAIKWEKIASITVLEPQHVYDLSIEGTRNFIANDIVAHNTYLATSSGKVGIGTTAPATVLDVKGKANFTGNFSIMNASDTLFFVDNTSGNVGIGTAAPTVRLALGDGTNIIHNISTTAGGEVAFNDFSADIDFRVESDTNINAFRVDAGLNTGIGAIGLFGAVNSGELISIIKPAFTAVANENTVILTIRNAANAVTIPTGTTAYVMSLNVEEPNIIATGTVTNAATVRIADAPTEASNNYALWVDDGVSRFDGNVGIGTTAPNAKLVVIGGANISGGLNVTAGNVLLASSSGIVSIGVESLRDALLIAGFSSSATTAELANSIVISNENTGNNVRASLFFRHSSNAPDGRAGGAISLQAGTKGSGSIGSAADIGMDFQVGTGSGALAQVMRLTGAGNVGIGNTIPNVTLHVSGVGNFSGNLFAGSCTGAPGLLCTDIAELFPAEDGLKAGDVVCLNENGNADYCSNEFDKKILGVVSTNPAIVIEGGSVVIGRGNYSEGSKPIALKGKVPVKVICAAPIKQGDLLVSSNKKGYAMKKDLANFSIEEKIERIEGTTLGKALETCNEGEKTIMAWVG